MCTQPKQKCGFATLSADGQSRAQRTRDVMASDLDLNLGIQVTEVRITTPVLRRETTQRVLEILRAEVGDRVRLDNPTQNLESYFLGVVERARAGGATSGATSGNSVAEFIRGDAADAERNQAAAVLDRLTRTVAPAAPVSAAPAAAEPAVDAARLAALSQGSPAAPVPVPVKPSAPSTAELARANDKLSSLLGGGPKQP